MLVVLVVVCVWRREPGGRARKKGRLSAVAAVGARAATKRTRGKPARQPPRLPADAAIAWRGLIQPGVHTAGPLLRPASAQWEREIGLLLARPRAKSGRAEGRCRRRRRPARASPLPPPLALAEVNHSSRARASNFLSLAARARQPPSSPPPASSLAKTQRTNEPTRASGRFEAGLDLVLCPSAPLSNRPSRRSKKRRARRANSSSHVSAATTSAQPL